VLIITLSEENLTEFIKNVCVYSSSSNILSQIYYQVAQELGMLMGKEGFNLIYGGGTLGTMYANANAVKDFGGKVIGVIPKKLHSLGIENQDCEQLIVTKCMRSRKDKLDKLADAAIALAGGFGTLEELSEMITQKQLGYNDKAIVILNTNGFYDDLLKFFEKMIKENFANQTSNQLFFVATTPTEVIDYLKNYKPQKFNVYEKIN
jgi:uncharacterized protein (TIGR00730 family)